jgi:hypothetical protein
VRVQLGRLGCEPVTGVYGGLHINLSRNPAFRVADEVGQSGCARLGQHDRALTGRYRVPQATSTRPCTVMVVGQRVTHQEEQLTKAKLLGISQTVGHGDGQARW